MSLQVLWRAFAAQAVCAGVPFLILVALPLPDDLFEDFGFVIGPAVWLLAAFAASRFIPAPRVLVMLSALAALVAATIVLVAASHDAAGMVALLGFTLSCAAAGQRRPVAAGGCADG